MGGKGGGVPSALMGGVWCLYLVRPSYWGRVETREGMCVCARARGSLGKLCLLCACFGMPDVLGISV